MLTIAKTEMKRCSR